MIADLAISRAANILVKRHGADAAIVTAQRADELLEAGDPDGCAIWKRVLAAVNELTQPSRSRARQLMSRDYVGVAWSSSHALGKAISN